MSISYENLPWLLPKPDDFSLKVKGANNINDLVDFARFSLGENQLTLLAKN